MKERMALAIRFLVGEWCNLPWKKATHNPLIATYPICGCVFVPVHIL